MQELASDVPKRRALESMKLSRASFYRHCKPASNSKREADVAPLKRTSPRSEISETEKDKILETLCLERFVDKSPREVFATLLDEGVYLCSVSSMYRILRANSCVSERRNQARRAHYTKPELIATAPNQVWSWDITKLKGPKKWSYFYLYVMMDIYSRYVVGWMVASRENAKLAQAFINETVAKYDVKQGELTIHSDRGAPMTAKTTSQLHADLGILQSLSRPQVSNDNPFSEATFKTIKYSAGFPERFENIQISRAYSVGFFSWYNKEHHHEGLESFTPEMVHYGLVEQVAKQRQEVLNAAYRANPSRFSKPPVVKLPAQEVYINRPLSAGVDVTAQAKIPVEARGVLPAGPRPQAGCIYVENISGTEAERSGARVALPCAFTQPGSAVTFH
jgi:putative transposase